MKEETIQRVFPSSDWFEAGCDQCADRTSVVLIEDQRACFQCLEAFYDENGDAVVQGSDLHFGNEPFQARTVLAILLAIAFSGVVLGSVLHAVMVRAL